MPRKAPSSFCILADTREQVGYQFNVVKPVIPFTCRRATLKTGDYQVEFPDGTPLGDRVVVERKSMKDLYSTIGSGRARFKREFERMSEYGYAALVIEADLSKIASPNWWLNHRTLMNPKSLILTLVAWSQRYGVHIIYVPSRRVAEKMTFRILERWARDHAKLLEVPA